MPPTALYGIADLKSVLLKNSKAARAALFIGCAGLFLSCASGGMKRSGPPPATMPAKPILNLSLVASSGPGLADGVNLINPAAVTSNGIGEIFISDKAANTIYKLSTALELMTSEGSPSSNEFNRPRGLACDAALNMYVADTGNKRIQILDHNLRFARSVTSYFDQNGESADFTQPDDISIDGEGNFWVADDDKVLKLDPFFNLILEISNTAPSSFIIGKVSSVRTSRGGQAAISDLGNQRIAVVSAAGNYVGEIPVQSPQSVAWDKSGNIWVIESGGMLSAFNVNDNLIFSFRSDNPGSKAIWVAFDPAGRLLLLDGGLRKLDIYEVVTGASSIGGK
jgi:tripartite motif-containing protein 71